MNLDKTIEICSIDEEIRRFRISQSIFTDEQRKEIISAWKDFQKSGGHKRIKQTVEVRCVPHCNAVLALDKANNPRDIRRGYNSSNILSYVQDEYRRIGPVEGYHFVLYNLIRGHEAGKGFSPTQNFRTLVDSHIRSFEKDRIIVRPYYGAMQNIYELSNLLGFLTFHKRKLQEEIKSPNRNPKDFDFVDYREKRIEDYFQAITTPFSKKLTHEQLSQIDEELKSHLNRLCRTR